MQKADKGPFLSAWRDHVANIDAFTQNVRLVDISGDGDSRLLIADQSQRLIAYKNININWESQLNEVPIALTHFYSQQTNPPVPFIAVACGNFIYIYKNTKPFYKSALPKIDMPKAEKELWEKYDLDANKFKQFIDELNQLKKDGVFLTYKSLEVLTITSQKKQYELVKLYKDDCLSISDNATCLDSIQTSSDEEGSQSQLVVGSELKKLYIYDLNGHQFEKQFDLEGVPCFLQTYGNLNEDYKIFVALRENKIQILTNGKFDLISIDLTSKPIAMVRVDKNIIVASMNESFSSYSFKAVKQYTLKTNSFITALEKMESKRIKMNAVIVATDSQELFIYSDKNLIYTLKTDGVVQAMRFGTFGREEGSLVLIYKKRGIDVRMLQRKFNFQQYLQQSQQKEQQQQIGEENTQPLNLPKKTKLFIEQSQRERDNPLSIHKNFQKDLMKLRLKTAEVYIQTLDDGNLQNNMLQTDENIRISANVLGLGPLFKIKINIENLSSEPLTELYINYIFDNNIFKILNPIYQIQFLLPHISLPIEIQVENIDKQGAGDSIRIMVCSRKRSNPLIGVIVPMPLSELRGD